MSACELCWAEAFTRSKIKGGSQVDHYHRLLVENHEGHSAGFSPPSTPPEPTPDVEPQPGDGPDYHGEHEAWERRQGDRWNR